MDVKILENLLQVMIFWGNLCYHHHQVIQERIMVNLGLLKTRKCPKLSSWTDGAELVNKVKDHVNRKECRTWNQGNSIQ